MAAKDQIESIFSGSNGAYLADLYAQWVENPDSVDSSFSDLFMMLDDAHNIIVKDARGASWSPRPLTDILHDIDEKAASTPLKTSQITHVQIEAAVHDSVHAIALINAYRNFGHQYAQLDPLKLTQRVLIADLDPKTYGFTAQDMDRPIFIGKNVASFLPKEIHTLSEIISGFQHVYCRSIAWEYMYLQDLEQRHWLMQQIEKQGFINLATEDKKRVLQQITEAVGLENFCQKRYVGVKRFGLDGAEVTIPALHALIRQAVQYDVQSISMGMAHRGRLNVLTNVIGKSFTALFHEFSGGSYKPEGISGAADVKYHLGYRKTVEVAGKEIELSMAFNPSHLEAVGAVVEGQVRAEQDRRSGKHLAVILHGDAAFAGQGVVYEILAMSQLPAYQTDGSIHIVINNQIGFTTAPEESFSGYYSTDVAKVARAPIIHVNGDDPEAVVKVMQLAVAFRERFSTDVVVDLVCYRRYGHNETDEPIFTQPVMTQAIRKHDNLYKVYADKLVKEGVISFADSETNWNAFQEYLQESYVVAQNYRVNEMEWIAKEWQEMKFRGQDRQNFSTAISYDMAQKVGKALSSYAEGFDCHPKLIRQLEAKAQMFSTGAGIDWATAEALAFGSLLVEGHPVRLTGQDCQRGTFSHRNAVLFDQKTQQPYVLLNHIQPEQAKIDIYNSHLSEFAVLGFEYGYSCSNANALILWEAQFGDFVNSAQIIIDQFISAGESKWLQMSGLVMLLPHAQEGQGAEHSSARLERFLQLCAEDNMQICNLTTPANYFHALRRQLKRNYRQPLVIMSPKSLLRHKLAQSPLSSFIDQTQFLPVIDEVDPAVIDKEAIKRVVICSGKVYYDLLMRRLELRCELQSEQIALVRLEQFYPFPDLELAEVLSGYPNAEMVWCQEEPENMGGWNFVDRKIEKILREMNHKTSFVKYVGRLPAASPATGLASVYKAEQATLVDQALGH